MLWPCTCPSSKWVIRFDTPGLEGLSASGMTKQLVTPDEELLLRIKTILVIRIVFLTGFVSLLIAFEHQSTSEIPVVYLSGVIIAAYALSISYALFLRSRRNLQFLAWFQAIGDLLVVAGLIFTTGGIESPLSFLFLFVIISASVMLPRAACYLTASGASILYGMLVDLEYFGVIQPIYFFPKTQVSYQGAYGFYIIALHVASYFAVAYLSSILNHRLGLIKDELKTKSIDLQKLRDFHTNVVQNMGNGLLTTDRSGRVTSVNTACETITGYSHDECLGKTCFTILPMPALKTFFDQNMNDPLPLHIKDECKRKDGEKIWVVMKISQLISPQKENRNESGALDGYICVFEDLTEIRKLEDKMKQSEQLAAVGKFSAGLAHEIRNPLASLSGSIQVLREVLQLDADSKRLMEIVMKETERLNAIVTDFLSFSQPRKNKNMVIDLTQLLQDLVVLMKNSNEYDPSIQIKLVTPPDHIIIQSEEDQIKQMVWNLCINGIQAMRAAGTLTIKLNSVQGYRHREFKTDRKGVLLIVEDQGCGIGPEAMKQIFDPFFTTRDEGVGLGLATVAQIVQRFAGHIEVESENDRGTRFEVFIPQERLLLSNRQADDKKTAPNVSAQT